MGGKSAHTSSAILCFSMLQNWQSHQLVQCMRAGYKGISNKYPNTPNTLRPTYSIRSCTGSVGRARPRITHHKVCSPVRQACARAAAQRG